MTVVAVGRDAADGGDGGGGMDFDDHDEADEEMDFDAPMPNSGREGSGPSMVAGSGSSPGGSGQRKSYGSGAGGGARYRECLKNHAVGLGTHAVDGCGEFMPAGEEGTLDALRCAACGCHRNFHRRDTEGGVAGAGGPSVGAMEVTAFHPQFSPYYPTPAGYLHHHQSYGFGPSPQRPPPLALPSTSGGGGHSREYEGDDASNPMMMMMGVGSGGGGGGGMLGSGGSPGMRKRFRTKFSQEQKDKMLELAERLGWRIQKHDEAAVQQFCEETGLKRHVLKVWMHNNKHTHGKKP